MYNNAAALTYTKEIVVAKMSNTTLPVNKENGQMVADFFEAIFNKLVELDDRAHQNKG